ncbi:hypothetical protein B0H14DRAFT_2611507 [Mycena olivaceomarginata]|nr:hypothetical protein B0H14DRAFT_2611507 [Mycena olivaceomarginata]
MLGNSSLEVDPAVMERARAYALEQADWERRTCTKLQADWGPLRVKAAMYLWGEDAAGGPEILEEEEHGDIRMTGKWAPSDASVMGSSYYEKPSNGHALMAVSASLEGIAAALKAESTGPSTPQRKTAEIKAIMTLELTEDEEPLI